MMRSKRQDRRLFPCPERGCRTRFNCDACLDEHLRTIHGSTYGGIIGSVPVAWVELCDGHADFPVERIAGGG